MLYKWILLFIEMVLDINYEPCHGWAGHSPEYFADLSGAEGDYRERLFGVGSDKIR
jgi:hypothetical protein